MEAARAKLSRVGSSKAMKTEDRVVFANNASRNADFVDNRIIT
jgi:hypothetical protein